MRAVCFYKGDRMQQLNLFTDNFKITEVGLDIIGTPDFEDWMDYGKSLASLDGRARQFAIGDWIVAGFDRYEQGKWETIIQLFGNDNTASIREYQTVSSSVKSSVRTDKLSWSHHKEVATFVADKQRQWLEQAAENKWSVRQLKDAIEEEKIQQIEEANKPVFTEVKSGDWWILGNHLLYCGDTSSQEFISRLPDASFAFADPPYGAEVAEWDDKFYWQHDYLIDKAPIVAVTPGIVSIFDFARLTTMPYRWSMSFWISNGMTRGALGFGNWIYSAIFSQEQSIHRNAQDFYKISITGGNEDHKGQKPVAMIVKLIELFTKKNEIVIDPFLGSGTTLIVCNQLDRVCIGGEINPDYCSQIIAKWENASGQKAIYANAI